MTDTRKARRGWLDIDLDGLRQTLARKGHGWIMRELAQNAFDEPVSRVDISIESRPRGVVVVSIEDDAPDGFQRLHEAWTMFAPSSKKADRTKAGRFCAGEKLVLAFCDTATIESTTGTVRFDAEGRHVSKRPARPAGTRFTGRMRLEAGAAAELLAAARDIIAPYGVVVTVNGGRLEGRTPADAFLTVLETEEAGPDGILRRIKAGTAVVLYTPGPEGAWLYELGLPVVETGDRWSVDVRQKVPQTLERDNVPPRFLRELRRVVLERTVGSLTEQEASARWVDDAIASPSIEPQAVAGVVRARFGDNVVTYDPSDPEANKLATAAGYKVLHGGTFDLDQWVNVRRAEVALPAGQVTPSPKPFSPDGRPLKTVDRADWPDAWVRFEEYAIAVGMHVLPGSPLVALVVTNDRGWPHRAACGPSRVLYWNVSTEGRDFFDKGPTDRVNALLIHELAHAAGEMDHLSAGFYHRLCDIGARLARLALERPDLFA